MRNFVLVQMAGNSSEMTAAQSKPQVVVSSTHGPDRAGPAATVPMDQTWTPGLPAP